MWNIKYILISILAVVFSFVVHEFSHWLYGEFLGYDMIMTLNTVYPASGKYNAQSDYMLISAVGPIITLIQTVVFFFLLTRSKNLYFFPFLFNSFYLQLMSGVMNFSRPNDLGRISSYLELGLFTIPILAMLLHSILFFRAIKLNEIKKKSVWITVFYAILFSSIWILTNQFFKVILI
ncbi:hypothetical protein [Marivirga sp.]|uniref:hypothetical protein n=1 Tax=Marivirga sp. TaxID=2018662 RepID=UPI002D80E790|nr:hypothetical protein [Marivirga sp.]HET8858803.1 hypothetical protein [Marivirga sp.]